MNARLLAVAAVTLSLSPLARAEHGGAHAAKTAPEMTVALVDAEAKAQKKSATVTVQVRGLKLVDAASVSEKPAAGQGHLHYQLDDGPVIATTAAKLSFHNLTSGPHAFKVYMAANDHSPLGEPQTVSLTVP